ncbi:hypothetical protein GCM10023232_18760 [Sphingosinicella ginsenosidimutans]|uniref:Uncharacterized protein n=1 Tax=Allosphingosinicella ginsenosidimutans TaxID=1176539 RepID=A0A5C6TRW1_9SPHN|nr:hypothetical protein [Sphingosinicella ginsenosidimutans]TXC62920.1 hypothetical protein FRZ32_04095 [Sphingosinicella ginsenosidimutans]
MKGVFKFLALAFIAGLSGAIATFIYHIALARGATPSLDLSYVDFISITLTALSLMITVLGFFVAAASVIGWTTIENKLRDHSVSYFKDQLKKDGQLRTEFEGLIASIAYEGIENFKPHEQEKEDGKEEPEQNGETEYKDEG